MKILLADDEENIKVVIEMLMTKKGYEFCYADNGEDALRIYNEEHPDLIIMDVMMPKLKGFEVCRQLRDIGSDTPIIILSAKGDIVDKSIGFTSGADDYLVKPFSSQELLLRTEALLRRGERKAQTIADNSADVNYSGGGLEINLKRHEVKVNGRKVELTPREFKLLAYMTKYSDQVFSKEQLQEHLWGGHYEGELAGITVLIRKIREKIEPKPSKPQFIQTVWGVGYKFICNK